VVAVSVVLSLGLEYDPRTKIPKSLIGKPRFLEIVSNKTKNKKLDAKTIMICFLGAKKNYAPLKVYCKTVNERFLRISGRLRYGILKKLTNLWTDK